MRKAGGVAAGCVKTAQALGQVVGLVAGLLPACAGAGPALAAPPVVSCGGAVLLGAAQLLCSHMQREQPPQICTFSWALLSSAGRERVVEGTFMLPTGAQNVQTYSGAGYSRALSNPIVLCQRQ